MNKRMGSITILLCTFFFAVHASASESRDHYRTFEDLNGKRIGVITGTVFEYVVNNTLDYTRMFNFTDMSEMVQSLRNGELDCIVDDEPILRYIASGADDLTVIDRLRTDAYALAFNRERHKLRREFDGRIRAMLADKTIEKIVDAWMKNEGETSPMPEASRDAVLRLGTFPDTPPFVFNDDDGNITGIDVEIVKAICRDLGYGLAITPMDFDSMFDEVQNGSVDVIAACITVTGDREPFVAFSIPYYHGGIAVMVRTDSIGE
jgi:ABC-type amino acid transport/signal transduction systems, periplasmic component/domain